MANHGNGRDNLVGAVDRRLAPQALGQAAGFGDRRHGPRFIPNFLGARQSLDRGLPLLNPYIVAGGGTAQEDVPACVHQIE